MCWNIRSGQVECFSSLGTDRHILSSRHTAVLVFSSQIQQFLLVWESFKCLMDLLYLITEHCPCVRVFGAFCEEVQFCFHLIQITVWTRSLCVSIISLCPLSLYLVSFLSDTVYRYSAILYSLSRALYSVVVFVFDVCSDLIDSDVIQSISRC